MIGLTTLVFGLFQLNRMIIEPMAIENEVHFKTADEVEEERIAALKKADTDGDTLNDYDELYIFRTSPFLPDSDSDGLDDGIEVAQSSDPNCPKGSTCRIASTNTGGEGSGTVDPSSPPNLSPDEETLLAAMDRVFGDMTDLTPEAMNQRLQELTPEELRQFMADIGVPPEMLNKTDDATMRKLLAETLVEIKDDVPTTDGESS